MAAKIDANTLLDLIPADKLAELSVETQVDKGVKKFTGHLFFKLLLFSLIKTDRISLRAIEHFYNSGAFRLQVGLHPAERTRHSSISERLEHIKVDFFKKLFEYVSKDMAIRYGLESIKSQSIKRFDSTIVSLSSKLLHFGMSNDGARKEGANKLNQLKFTVGFNGLTVQTAQFHAAQNYLNENKALSEAILTQDSPDQGITVFDQGVRGRKTFALLTEKGVQFVTRIDAFPKHEELESRIIEDKQTETLDLEEDLKVHQFSSNGKVKSPLRLITAVQKKDDKVICFLTNIFDLTPNEITEIYKKRWDIEVFFRFIKQELNFSHLVSRTQNGIQVMFYLTMIAAMLILVYRKINDLKGFKFVKMQFVEELEGALLKEIIKLSGGNPNILDQYPLKP